MKEYDIKFYDTLYDFYEIVKNKAESISLNSPFQYRVWQELLYKEHLAFKKRNPYVGVVMFRKNELCLAGNFFIKTSGRKKGVFFLGSGGETDYFDLIYLNEVIEENDIQSFLQAIYRNYREIHIFQIRDSSPLSKWANNNVSLIRKNECACISFVGTYEEYFKSLKNSVRQNIRTANNRLVKDEHKKSIKIYDRKNIPEDLIIELSELYEKRRVKKNTKENYRGIKHWILENVRTYRKKKFNIISEAMKMGESWLAVLKIDIKVAAYCFGLKDNDGKLYIMQVAINDDYRRYSPGMILLTDAFEELLSNRNKLLFDLTNGNESYKFSLGAETHYTYYYNSVFSIE